MDYNIPLIIDISNYLELNTAFVKSSELMGPDDSSTGLDKIMRILRSTNSETYLSGAGAGSRRYIQEEAFEKNSIILQWQKLEFKPYQQLNSNMFVSGLSIIDLIFNCGKNSVNYL